MSKRKPNPTPLQQEVITWMEGHEEEDRKVAYQDLRNSGCISGMVPEMVFYTDTVAFFERHKEAINALVKEGIDMTGEGSFISNFNNYDEEDPLYLEQQNQNNLAWYAFEETAYQLYDEDYQD